MEPRIQYAKTKDGVSIAVWTLGEGRPLVFMPTLPFSNAQLEWNDPGWRRLFRALADRIRIIRYDARGSGLSQRNVDDYSLEAHLLDLDAVADRLRLEPFALYGFIFSSPVAIAYAARHPERVSHLLLQGPIAEVSSVMTSPLVEGLMGLLDKDWKLFTEAMSRAYFGWEQDDRGREYAATVRESMSQQAAAEAFGAIREFDVSALLHQVRSATLVIQSVNNDVPGSDVVRDVASQIPDARLAIAKDELEQAHFVLEFLGVGDEPAPDATSSGPATEDIHTILFTDIEGSTDLTQRLGDAKAQDVLRTHNSIIRDALKSHSGSEIKHTGEASWPPSHPLAAP